MNQRPFFPFVALSAILLIVALPYALAGCGAGRFTHTAVAAAAAVTSLGRAQFTVRWPEPGRLVPFAAQSIRVSVFKESVLLGEKILIRPMSGGETSAVLDGLAVGVATVRVAAYPTADGTGTAQASANTDVEIRAGEITPIRMTLATTITDVEITPTVASLRSGDSIQFSAMAKNALREMVLTHSNTLVWTSSTTDIAGVDASGNVSAAAPGLVTIRATETESGKFGEQTIKVLPAPLKNSDVPGLALRFRSADAVGTPNLTAWSDSSGSGNKANFIGPDVMVVPNAFGEGISGVNIGDNGLQFANVSGIRTIYIVVKGGNNYAGITNWAPVIGQSDISRGRAFRGENNRIPGAVRYLESEPHVFSDSSYLTKTWQNGQPTLENALNVSPSEATLLTFELPSEYPFDCLAREFNGYFRGGRWTYGEVVLSTEVHTKAQREFIQHALMADYRIDPNAALHDLVVEMDDSIGFGWWGGIQSNRLAARLNGARVAAGQPIKWDTVSVGYRGNTVYITGAAKEAKRAMMARFFSANRVRKIYLGSKGTNDISSYATPFTAKQTIDAIVEEIAAAKSAGATHTLYRTLLDRGAYGEQITGVGFPGETEQERKQAEFNDKRESVNRFLRSKVYPVGNVLAGQSLLNAISDAGAQTIKVGVTVADGTVLDIGAPNPVGKNGATGTEGMYKFWAAYYGQRGTSATDKNDRIHPSDLGADILTTNDYTALQAALTAH